jgi:hypothetical protein
MPLPTPVLIDLFDLEYKPSQASIDHIADMVEDTGFRVYDINNYDTRIWLNFGKNGSNVDGGLVIDRVDCGFEIFASNGDVRYASVSAKDFTIIEGFLNLLKEDVEREY